MCDKELSADELKKGYEQDRQKRDAEADDDERRKKAHAMAKKVCDDVLQPMLDLAARQSTSLGWHGAYRKWSGKDGYAQDMAEMGTGTGFIVQCKSNDYLEYWIIAGVAVKPDGQKWVLSVVCSVQGRNIYNKQEEVPTAGNDLDAIARAWYPEQFAACVAACDEEKKKRPKATT